MTAKALGSTATTCTVAGAMALALLVLGPSLDDAATAQATALSVRDAQQQAQHNADYLRWARRICRDQAAAWMQQEGGAIQCYTADGQRISTTVAGVKP